MSLLIFGFFCYLVYYWLTTPATRIVVVEQGTQRNDPELSGCCVSVLGSILAFIIVLFIVACFTAYMEKDVRLSSDIPYPKISIFNDSTFPLCKEGEWCTGVHAPPPVRYDETPYCDGSSPYCPMSRQHEEAVDRGRKWAEANVRLHGNDNSTRLFVYEEDNTPPVELELFDNTTTKKTLSNFSPLNLTRRERQRH